MLQDPKTLQVYNEHQWVPLPEWFANNQVQWWCALIPPGSIVRTPLGSAHCVVNFTAPGEIVVKVLPGAVRLHGPLSDPIALQLPEAPAGHVRWVLRGSLRRGIVRGVWGKTEWWCAPV